MLPTYGLMDISDILNELTDELREENDRAYAKTSAYIKKMAEFRKSVFISDHAEFNHHDSVRSVVSFAGRVAK